ncbi:hypothetical protein BJ742DRAFT_790572 [Cladochytrium replicatum]|nr:hypothetical protein BJ742DRAFT_790572 [Cladochytrium replicatum]
MSAHHRAVLFTFLYIAANTFTLCGDPSARSSSSHTSSQIFLHESLTVLCLIFPELVYCSVDARKNRSQVC